MCAQNGAANEYAAFRYFERVYGVCVWLPSTLAEPGVVVASAVPGFGNRLALAEAEEVYRRAGIEPVNLEREYAARGDDFSVAEVPGLSGCRWFHLAEPQPGPALPTVEVDCLNGEIVALGRAHGLPCPVNERLRQIVNAMAAARVPPGSLSAAEILTQLTSGGGDFLSSGR